MNSMRTAFVVLAAALVASVSTLAADLRIGLRTETNSIDPNFWTTVENWQVADHMFDSLVMKDHQNRLLAGLAESWKPIDDKTWEFRLRRGVKWQDGSPFTADDVVFTYDRAKTLKGSSAPTGRFLQAKEYRKVDDFTIHVSTDGPYPLMPNELSVLYIVSKKNAEGAEVEDFNSGKATVGSGPYRFVEWVKGDRIVLDAFADYWGGKPAWDRVTLKPIKADPTRIAALLNGDVDMINSVPTTDMAKLRNDPKVTLVEIAGERIVYLTFDSNRDLSPFVKDNAGNPLVPNPLRMWEVRKAISKAIDRRAIVERVMDGAAAPAGQMAPPGMFGFNPELTPEPFDLDGAKRLLAQVGYPNGFRLTLHATNDDHPNDTQIAETIAGMLTRMGIKTEVVTMPKAIFYVTGRQGGEYRLPAFSFQLYSRGTETGESSNQFAAALHTYNAQLNFGASNHGRYSNFRADARLENALITLDDGKREKLLQEAAAIYIGDMAVIPLHYQANVWGLRKGLAYQGRLQEKTLAMRVSRVQ